MTLLRAEDWASIGREFEKNQDPFAAERETRDFQKLFTRVVDLAPSRSASDRPSSPAAPPGRSHGFSRPSVK